MSHKEKIFENGYCIFDLNKSTDSDSTTPIDVKYVGIVLCYEGECTLEANMRNYKLAKGDCLCIDNLMYKSTVQMSEDFSAKVLISLSSYAFDSIVGIPMGFMESIYTKPIIHVDDPLMWKIINNYFVNLEALQQLEFGSKRSEIMALTYRLLMLVMATLRGVDSPQVHSPLNQGDIYYRQFVELIDDNVKRQHEVAYYAGKLSITAKYLSEVCKIKSGHKAKEIVSSFLISKIKQELAMTGKSIKSIAYEYGFSDQSSMGKFFVKKTGMAPGDFRKLVATPEIEEAHPSDKEP